MPCADSWPVCSWGYLHTAAPVTGTGFEFRVIGAVIVGGVLLSGGRGTIYGSLVGAVIIGMITSGLVLMGFSQDIGDVATGVLIVAVGTFDLLARRAARGGWPTWAGRSSSGFSRWQARAGTLRST